METTQKEALEQKFKEKLLETVKSTLDFQLADYQIQSKDVELTAKAILKICDTAFQSGVIENKETEATIEDALSWLKSKQPAQKLN